MGGESFSPAGIMIRRSSKTCVMPLNPNLERWPFKIRAGMSRMDEPNQIPIVPL